MTMPGPKERGITFDADAVRAILAGTKSQTRCLVKPQPVRSLPHTKTVGTLSIHHPLGWRWLDRFTADRGGDFDGLFTGKLPYVPGERLYVPMAASRITLEITEVRCARLQDITEEDAEAEGVTAGRSGAHPGGDDTLSSREIYRDLWDEINGKKAPWASNPWVWAITFERIEAANG